MVKACVCSLPNSRVYISVSCSLIQSVHHYCKERLDMGKVKKSSSWGTHTWHSYHAARVIRLGLRFDWVTLSASCMWSDTLYFPSSSYSVRDMQSTPLCWLVSFCFELLQGILFLQYSREDRCDWEFRSVYLLFEFLAVVFVDYCT